MYQFNKLGKGPILSTMNHVTGIANDFSSTETES